MMRITKLYSISEVWSKGFWNNDICWSIVCNNQGKWSHERTQNFDCPPNVKNVVSKPQQQHQTHWQQCSVILSKLHRIENRKLTTFSLVINSCVSLKRLSRENKKMMIKVEHWKDTYHWMKYRLKTNNTNQVDCSYCNSEWFRSETRRNKTICQKNTQIFTPERRARRFFHTK